MKLNIELGEPQNGRDHPNNFSQVKSKCANNCVAVRNLLGHVGIYAPSKDCELRLVFHHI